MILGGLRGLGEFGGFAGFMGLWVSWVFWCIQVEKRFVPYTLAEVRLPSPLGDDTCKALRPRRALGGNNGLTKRETSFLPPPPGKKGCYLSKSNL